MTRRPRHDDDDDELATVGEAAADGDEAAAQVARRSAAPVWDEAIDTGQDTAAEARAIARAKVADAMRILVSVMHRPYRRSGVQLAAVTKVLEAAGIGATADEVERRTVARIIEVAREEMDSGELRKLARVLAKVTARDAQGLPVHVQQAPPKADGNAGDAMQLGGLQGGSVPIRRASARAGEKK